MYYWSPSTRGFYHPDIHGPKLAPVTLKRGLLRKPLTTKVLVAASSIPADAVEITDAEHRELLIGQGEGRVIAEGPDGRPRLVEP